MKSFPKKPAKLKVVYLDHAATTPTDPAVVKAMAPFWTKNFANPSALYSLGRSNHETVEQARKTIAEILFTQPDCITFTSGGTESNNMAILGLCAKIRHSGEGRNPQPKLNKVHIITTVIEHHSVLGPIQELEKRGVEVTYIPVNEHGEISVSEVMKAIRPETKLISIMYANNEIGTINPIAEIGRQLLKYRQKKCHSDESQNPGPLMYPYFHVDACQAAGTLDLHVERLHVDLLTLNGSKIYGPKGTGILFVRRGVPLQPILFGGGQENGLRSGTENVPGIIGLSKALELVQKNFAREAKCQTILRNYFWEKIQSKIPDVKLNGPAIDEKEKRLSTGPSFSKEGEGGGYGTNANRLANNLNISFKNLEAETLVLYLDAYGIITATGSACASDSSEASHVLSACGINSVDARGSVRFTLGKSTTKKDLDYVMKYLPGIVEGVRTMSRQ